MKMTKLFAVVMAVAMMLSAMAFSASAAAFEDVTATVETDASGNCEIVNNADGSIDLSLINPGAPAVGFGYVRFHVSAEQFANYDYLVVEFGEGTSNVHVWSYWQAGADVNRNDGTPFTPVELNYSNVAPADYAGNRVVLEMSRFEPTVAGDNLIVAVYPITTEEGFDVTINKVFVTNDADVDTGDNNQGGGAETGAESAVAVAVAAVIGAGALFAVSRKMK